MRAVAAMGAGRGDALAFGHARDEDVQKTAESEAEQGCEDGAGELDFVEDVELRSCAGVVRRKSSHFHTARNWHRIAGDLPSGAEALLIPGRLWHD